MLWMLTCASLLVAVACLQLKKFRAVDLFAPEAASKPIGAFSFDSRRFRFMADLVVAGSTCEL